MPRARTGSAKRHCLPLGGYHADYFRVLSSDTADIHAPDRHAGAAVIL